MSIRRVLGFTEIKIQKLVSKNKKKHQQEKRVSLLYRERVSEMRVPVETQQVPESGPEQTCLFCSYRNGMVRLRNGPISGSLFHTTRILNLFWNGSLGLFLYPCVNATSLPTGLLERTGAYQYKIITMAV